MLKTFWINNQKFLLLCGGALLAFLMLTSFLGRLADGAERTYTECAQLQREIDQLHKKLKRTYWLEIRKAQAYEEHEGGLAEKVGLPPEPELKDPRKLPLQFLGRIDRIWGDVQAEASSRGLVLPQKLTLEDFDATAQDGPVEYQLYHSYLDIVEASLRALVLAGMTRMGRPELIPEAASDVVVDEAVVGTCLYRGAAYAVEGPPSSFIRLLQLTQKGQPFLQVRIASLSGRRSRAGDDDVLRGDIEFYGFRVGPPETDESGGIPGLGTEKRRPRRRRR